MYFSNEDLITKAGLFDVNEQNFDDLLVTDELFVDYFNAFLNLPTFKEKICFNRENQNFEVFTDEGEVITKRIQSAAGRQKPRPSLLTRASHHSYKPIPLIPMEKRLYEVEEIDPSFTVEMLRREHSLEWIKCNRLPSYLQSTLYFEYRLAKLLSQVFVNNEEERNHSYAVQKDTDCQLKDKKQEAREKKLESERIFLTNCHVKIENLTNEEIDRLYFQLKSQYTSKKINVCKPELMDSVNQTDVALTKVESKELSGLPPADFKNYTGFIGRISRSSAEKEKVFKASNEKPMQSKDSVSRPTEDTSVTYTTDALQNQLLHLGDQSNGNFGKPESEVTGTFVMLTNASDGADKQSKNRLAEFSDEHKLLLPDDSRQTEETARRKMPRFSDPTEAETSDNITTSEKKMSFGTDHLANANENIRSFADSMTEELINDGVGTVGSGTTFTRPEKSNFKAFTSEGSEPGRPTKTKCTKPKKDNCLNNQPNLGDSFEKTTCAYPFGANVSLEPGVLESGRLTSRIYYNEERNESSPVSEDGEKKSEPHWHIDSSIASSPEPKSSNLEAMSVFSAKNPPSNVTDITRFTYAKKSVDFSVHLSESVNQGEAQIVQVADKNDVNINENANTQGEQENITQTSEQSGSLASCESKESSSEGDSALSGFSQKVRDRGVSHYVTDVSRRKTRPHNLEIIDNVAIAKQATLCSTCKLDASRDLTEEQVVCLCPPCSKRYFNLGRKRGIDALKSFLTNTNGEPIWTFCLDIDKSSFINGYGDERAFLSAMREMYDRKGSPLELKGPLKRRIGLSTPSSWNMASLQNAKRLLLGTLLEYWVPRYLLSNQQPSLPLNGFQKGITLPLPGLSSASHTLKARPASASVGVNPSPRTAWSKPLRPRSCAARVPPLPEKDDPPELTLPEVKPPLPHRRTFLVDSLVTPMDAKIISEQMQTKEPRRAMSAKNGRRISVRQQDRIMRVKSAGVSRSLGASLKAIPKSSEPTQRKNSSESVLSVFLGSRRLEQLLSLLSVEREAGWFFHRFLLSSGNQLWINCANFWHELQNFHNLFYLDVIQPIRMSHLAKVIFSKFIMSGGEQDISCQTDIKTKILHCLEPAFEELFDAAEEYILDVLYEPMMKMIELDMNEYDQIEKIGEKRIIDSKGLFMLKQLQHRGVMRQQISEPDTDDTKESREPVFDETLIQSIPEQFKSWTFARLVSNRVELEHFKDFLTSNHAVMDLNCWLDIEMYRKTPHEDEELRVARGTEIRTKYLNKKYLFSPNSPASKYEQNQIMEEAGGWGKLLKEVPPTSMLLRTQRFVERRLGKKWLPLFLLSNEFNERQKPRISMDDVADDMLMIRRKRQQQIVKMLDNNKWASSWGDILALRKALLNPVTCAQFRKFMAIKGKNYENNIDFWIEVQKYKNMYHLHVEDSLIQQKITTLINCFIDSNIPPPIQIDITQEQADKILECRKELGPYVFRESQLTVFRVLLNFWPDFVRFRQSLAEERVIKTIERQKERVEKRFNEKLAELAALKENEGIYNDDPEAQEAAAQLRSGLSSRASAVSDDQHNSRVSFKYSQYLKGLEEESVLNLTNEETFRESLHEIEVAKKNSRPIY